MRLLSLLIVFFWGTGFAFAQKDPLKTSVRFIPITEKDSVPPVSESIKKQLIALQRQEPSPKKYLRLTLNLKNQPDGILTCRWLAVRQKKDILHVNLSALVSKYIGETEKNLEQVFSRASSGNMILFFDEADALFGKRTTDSEANPQQQEKITTILIKKVENYKGPVILSCHEEACQFLSARLKFIRISG